MKIRLLQDVIEYDRHGASVGIKSTRKKNRAWSAPVVVHDQLVQSKEPQYIDIQWVKGAVIDASDATGQKYIDAGKAVAE